MPVFRAAHIGAVLGALAFTAPVAHAATGPSPHPGGMAFDDPNAPSVFADGSTLTAPMGDLLGDDVVLRGSVAGTRPGQRLDVQRLDARAGWTTAATTIVAADGTFQAVWHADHAGRTAVRVIPAATPASTTASAAQATTASGAPAAAGRPLTVYRRARATWYGPGLYGRRTACGQRLTRTLIGVAHRTLPCGTRVELFKDGRTIVAPVVDRGPFRRGASYDLTTATAQALGMSATATIGVVPAATPSAT